MLRMLLGLMVTAVIGVGLVFMAQLIVGGLSLIIIVIDVFTSKEDDDSDTSR